MNSVRIFFAAFVIFFSANTQAGIYCESFNSVQLKEHYNANFLNKDFRGCFEIYFNERKNDASPVGAFSVELGNHITSITNANAAEISYATFTSFGNYRTTSKKLSNDTDEVLRTIRFEAAASSKKIDQDLSNFRDVYNADGIKAIKDNSSQITKDLENLKLKINDLKQANVKIRAIPTALLNPDSISELQKNTSTDPVNKEKDKWQSLKNINAVPFHTLKKIYKDNPIFGAKILEDIKYARYMEMGLLKSTALPLLGQVQKYESKTNTYNAKYDLAKNSISENDQYLKEKKFVLTASYELKKMADSKLIQGDLDKANDSLDMATLALEITTSLPLAATGRGLYEFLSGKSLLTNRDLSNFERGASLSIVFIDLMPAAWIASGVRGTWLVGELGARLVEKGIIKAGFEDALNIGVENAKLISETFQELLASGSAKIETIKRVIEHKIFFNYLPQEAYIASKAFQKEIIIFEKQYSKITVSGVELDLKSEQNLAYEIKHAGDLGIKTSEGFEAYTKIYEAAETLPEYLSIKRIKEGANTDKLAVIGRTMGDQERVGVLDVAKHFEDKKIKVETFDPGDSWDSFMNTVNEYRLSVGDPMAKLPNNLVVKTEMYLKNKAWAEKLLQEGYIVLDIGDPNGLNIFSPFYSLEKSIIYK